MVWRRHGRLSFIKVSLPVNAQQIGSLRTSKYMDISIHDRVTWCEVVTVAETLCRHLFYTFRNLCGFSERLEQRYVLSLIKGLVLSLLLYAIVLLMFASLQQL